MATPTTLKGITSLSGVTFSDQTEANLLSFFEWGMLNIGGFTNINAIPEGTYYGDTSRLRPVQDPNFNDGQVWEAGQSNWVWESGMELPLTSNPIRVSGVFVNSTFYPSSTSGQYSFIVNYPAGRIVFNNPIPTTSIVQCSYSAKWIMWDLAESSYFREAIHQAYNAGDPTYLQFGSGNWQQLYPARVQYPFVAIEVVDADLGPGYELGGGTWLNQDVLFHVFTETRSDRNKICDIIFNQNLKNIFYYDIATAAAMSLFPLDQNGSIAPLARNYPQLVNDPALRLGFKVYFNKTTKQIVNQLSPKIFHGVVRTTMVSPHPEL